MAVDGNSLTLLVITSDLLEPLGVLCHFKFQGHGCWSCHPSYDRWALANVGRGFFSMPILQVSPKKPFPEFRPSSAAVCMDYVKLSD